MTRVEEFERFKRETEESFKKMPFETGDAIYIHDALMNIAGSLAVIADALTERKEVTEDE